MNIDNFIEEFGQLLDKYNFQFTGQLLVSEKEFPHEITHNEQAYWGQIPVRDRSSITVTPKIPPQEPVIFQKGVAPFMISDDLGIKGILNHADGKMYDSKSAYKKAVKAAGLEILGNDAPRDVKPAEPKIDMRELKRDIAQSIQQLGG